MKRFFKMLISIIVIVLISFIIFKLSDKYKIKITKNNIECTIVTKGCEDAVALAYNNGEIFIAYNNYIKYIDNEGKEQTIYKTDKEVEDIIYYKGSIVIICNNKLIKYDLEKGSEKVLFNNIPLSGNCLKRKLLIYKDDLYLTIGSETNSGIKDNGEIEDTTINDVEKINNATVYKVDMNNNKITQYATGIRGITGIDVNSNGEIYSIFSGIQEGDNRNVIRDRDYIYLLKENQWYGWPDFSGGDYINSARFAKDNLIEPILKNPKSKVVPAPIYISNEVNSLKELSIDKEGVLLPKDSMVFWDKDSNVIYALINNNSIIELLKLVDRSNIEDIQYTEDGFLILDNKVGCIYSLHEKMGIFKFKLPMSINVYIVVLVVSVVGVVGYKKVVGSRL